MKKRQIAFNFRKDGTIRAYQAQSKDKRGVPEINIICPTLKTTYDNNNSIFVVAP